MSLLRVARASVYSGVLCALLATRIVVGFHSFRAKLVEHESVSPVADIARVEIEPARTSNDLLPPFAVIARIWNGSATLERFAVRIDGRTVCDRSVPGGATRRIDCAWDGEWAPDVSH